MLTDNNTQVSLQLPTLRREHKLLDVFVGTWIVEGQNKEGAPVAPGAQVSGKETYEWLPGEYYLVYRWDRCFGSDQHTGIGIIGYDDSSQTYASHNFDNLGYSRTYQVHIADGSWTLTGERERARLVFSDDGNVMTANWEISGDGFDWTPLCELKAIKAE